MQKNSSKSNTLNTILNSYSKRLVKLEAWQETNNNTFATRSALDRAQQDLQKDVIFITSNLERHEHNIEKLEDTIEKRIDEVNTKIDDLSKTIIRTGEETRSFMSAIDNNVAAYIHTTNNNTMDIKQLSGRIDDFIESVGVLKEVSDRSNDIIVKHSPEVMSQKVSSLETDLKGSNGLVKRIESIEKFFNNLGWKILGVIVGAIGVQIVIMYISKLI